MGRRVCSRSSPGVIRNSLLFLPTSYTNTHRVGGEFAEHPGVPQFNPRPRRAAPRVRGALRDSPGALPGNSPLFSLRTDISQTVRPSWTYHILTHDTPSLRGWDCCRPCEFLTALSLVEQNRVNSGIDTKMANETANCDLRFRASFEGFNRSWTRLRWFGTTTSFATLGCNEKLHEVTYQKSPTLSDCNKMHNLF